MRVVQVKMRHPKYVRFGLIEQNAPLITGKYHFDMR